MVGQKAAQVNFILNTMNFVSKVMNFAFKMMDFVSNSDDARARPRRIHSFYRGLRELQRLREQLIVRDGKVWPARHGAVDGSV